ncbi:MAG: T9SS type A sorting domain-containing protein, partial [Candidatus Marinimicrobia bacterium]|nr:T9SS type A sorting domain-containing protein [Candidatus Neomarinimicrobiota bacterium]
NQLDPGETVDFAVIIVNNGSTGATNVQVILNHTEPLITVPNNSATVLEIPAGESATFTYTNIVADPTMQAGTRVDFTLDITADGNYSTQDDFSILVGDERYQPSGPDGYGYFAYDMYDGVLAPAYNWFEVAPMAGGPGITQTFSDDQIRQVTLPFTFRYYGQEYTQISVCSNGFLCMGTESSTSYSNYGIPTTSGPEKIICPLWDDLNPSTGGQIAWYHDAANNRFIVEWYHVPHYSAGGPETFQAILYNPSFYPTLTGDGEIQINYHTVDSPGSVTCGIENQSGNIGLQFLYNGSYDPHAMPLENGFAIKYTTGLNLGGDLLFTLTPASLPIVIPVSGGSFSFTVDIENIGTEPATFQGWLDAVLPNGSTYNAMLRSGLQLAAGASIVRDMNQNVPASAPSGDYVYWGRAGVHPNDPWTEDSFPFSKAAGDFSGVSLFNDWSVEGWDVDLESALPTVFSMSQNYPNPFNPLTSIDFSLPEAAKVNLSVYNLLGQKIATLVEGMTPAGKYTVQWNATEMSSGVYFFHLQAGDNSSIKKCILMK